MTFVTRSSPFWRPRLHTTKPAITVTAIQAAISPGEASILPNTASTPPSGRAEKVPAANLKK